MDCGEWFVKKAPIQRSVRRSRPQPRKRQGWREARGRRQGAKPTTAPLRGRERRRGQGATGRRGRYRMTITNGRQSDQMSFIFGAAVAAS